MAAARGNVSNRTGSVFTVQTGNNCGDPGPCRDGLNSFTGRRKHPALSRDGSRDVLAEVRVQTPYGGHSLSETTLDNQVGVIMYSDKFEARLRLIGALSASSGSDCKSFFFPVWR